MFFVAFFEVGLSLCHSLLLDRFNGSAHARQVLRDQLLRQISFHFCVFDMDAALLVLLGHQLNHAFELGAPIVATLGGEHVAQLLHLF